MKSLRKSAFAIITAQCHSIHRLSVKMRAAALIAVVISCASAAQTAPHAQQLGKRGYELADLITAEMRNVGYTYDYAHPEERISDVRRMTFLRTMPTDTIYGLFSSCSNDGMPYYAILSSVDKIVLNVNELPGHVGLGCYFPDEDLTEYAQKAFLGLNEDPNGRGHRIFIIKILYKDRKFKILNSKIHKADISNIRD